MKSQHFVDEAVLADLLKNDPTNSTWKAMFERYQQPYVGHFEQLGYCTEKSQTLFREMFALLVTGIRENLLKAPFEHTLFEYMVMMGEQRMANMPASLEEIPPHVPHQNKCPFLSGEVLIVLVKKEHSKTLTTIYQYYRDPVFAMLKSRYGLNGSLVEEQFGESVAILFDNIRKAKLQPNMTAMLFTYFFRLTRNRVLEADKILKRMPSSTGSTEDAERILSRIPEQEPEPDFDEILPIPASVWESLSPVLEAQDDLFEKLIAPLKPASREALRLYFLEGLRHKEIGRRLNIKEVTARKRVFDGLEKLRKHFARKHGLKQKIH